jgi:hypothetical protein
MSPPQTDESLPNKTGRGSVVVPTAGGGRPVNASR